MEDNQDQVKYFDEPQPDTAEPREVFTQIAADLGIIRPGDKLDQNLVDFAYAVVEKAASIADGYFNNTVETNAGEHIRAELGDVCLFPGLALLDSFLRKPVENIEGGFPVPFEKAFMKEDPDDAAAGANHAEWRLHEDDRGWCGYQQEHDQHC